MVACGAERQDEEEVVAALGVRRVPRGVGGRGSVRHGERAMVADPSLENYGSGYMGGNAWAG